jgi:hypothetical protein
MVEQPKEKHSTANNLNEVAAATNVAKQFFSANSPNNQDTFRLLSRDQRHRLEQAGDLIAGAHPIPERLLLGLARAAVSISVHPGTA